MKRTHKNRSTWHFSAPLQNVGELRDYAGEWIRSKGTLTFYENESSELRKSLCSKAETEQLPVIRNTCGRKGKRRKRK